MILSAKHLKKGFLQDGEKLEILRDVSFEILRPETLALMGRSGCGKSTLISLLAGLERPDEGQIEILDKNINQMPDWELNRFRARHIGIIFQQFHLLDHLTAFENVRLPLDLNPSENVDHQNADQLATEMLSKVGLRHRLGHFPDQLSRGECQRVAIARVLVMKPELLLADEPTGSLDVKTGREVMDLIFSLVAERGISLVMATHDPGVAERCDRKIEMSAGQLL
jgi:putative ABC transport system ATP-binding protein